MRAFFAAASDPTAQSDASLRRCVELLPDVIFETDAAGTVVFLGGASLALLGRPAADCLHRPLASLMAEESRPALAALMRREPSTAPRQRVRVARPDGSDGWALLSTAPADSGGIIGTLQDFGAERRAEDELQQLKDKVAATAAAKKVYISNISHQVRTPLAAIIGLSQLCLGTRTTDKQRDYLTKTEQAAQDLHRVVNNILDFSGMDSGGIKLESGPFQVRNLLAQIDGQMRPLARAKELELQIERGDTLPATLIGDPSRLQQVLVNLIGNAIKFTAKGSICVSAHVTAQEASRATLEFRVSDTGMGLQPQQLGGIFEAHTHAEGATTRPFAGMGLGLAIAKRLVEKMGGSIWVTSTPGIGSTFYFTVQYLLAEAPSPAAAAPEAVSPPPAARPRLRNVRILVVEDNRFNQQIAREFLEAAGAQVTVAENGARALQCISAEPRFDAVLMDVQMPVMDGLEATRRIRSNPSLSQLPVIALTANTTAADRLACSEAGMNDFEVKPIDPERLFATISRWLPNRHLDSGRHVLPAAAPGAGVDRTALAKLVNFDPVKIRRFALKFVENSRATMAEMQNTSKHSDLIALGRLAHRLKSSAATVGAAAFSTLCKDLEGVCQNNDAAQAMQLVRELAAALDGVNSELLADDGT